MKGAGKEGRAGGEKERVCIQVCRTARWIARPNGRLITVIEGARSEQRVERRDRREGGGERRETGSVGVRDVEGDDERLAGRIVKRDNKRNKQ